MCPAVNQLSHMAEFLNASTTFFLVFHVEASPHRVCSCDTTSDSNALTPPAAPMALMIPGGVVPLAAASAAAAAALFLAASSVWRILRRLMRFTSFCSLCPAACHLLQKAAESLKLSKTFFLTFQAEISPHH